MEIPPWKLGSGRQTPQNVTRLLAQLLRLARDNHDPSPGSHASTASVRPPRTYIRVKKEYGYLANVKDEHVSVKDERDIIEDVRDICRNGLRAKREPYKPEAVDGDEEGRRTKVEEANDGFVPKTDDDDKFGRVQPERDELEPLLDDRCNFEYVTGEVGTVERRRTVQSRENPCDRADVVDLTLGSSDSETEADGDGSHTSRRFKRLPSSPVGRVRVKREAGDDGGDGYKCPDCNYSAADMESAVQHMLERHVDVKRSGGARCKPGERAEGSRSRSEPKRERDSDAYRCPDCDYGSADVNAVVRHMVRRHVKVEHRDGASGVSDRYGDGTGGDRSSRLSALKRAGKRVNGDLKHFKREEDALKRVKREDDDLTRVKREDDDLKRVKREDDDLRLIKREHDDNMELYKCCGCDYVTSKTDEFALHMIQSHVKVECGTETEADGTENDKDADNDDDDADDKSLIIKTEPESSDTKIEARCVVCRWQGDRPQRHEHSICVYRCVVCDFCTESRPDLFAHLLAAHGKETTSDRCFECELKTATVLEFIIQINVESDVVDGRKSEPRDDYWSAGLSDLIAEAAAAGGGGGGGGGAGAGAALEIECVCNISLGITHRLPDVQLVKLQVQVERQR